MRDAGYKPVLLPPAADSKRPQAYGNIWRTLAASAGWTRVSFFSRRMRLAGLVPSRCRLPECMRSSLPVEVSLKRLAAPRCVLSLRFLATGSFLRLARSRLAGIGRRRLPRGAFLRRQQRHQNVGLHARPEFHLSVLGDVF